MAANAADQAKTIADPCAAYESVAPLWKRSRAACGGERFVKEYDATLDRIYFKNMLIPFSPSMTDVQYKFYKSEAEWPGISKSYARTLVGGLLRKKPTLKLPESVSKEAHDWLMNSFGKDGSALTFFLDEAIWEELQTSRAWVFVDYPKVANAEALTREEILKLHPYPILRRAEEVINWRVEEEKETGIQKLTQVLVRGFEEVVPEGKFHPELLDTIWVHEIFEGKYRIRKFQKAAATTQATVVNGQRQTPTSTDVFKEAEVIDNILIAGEPLDFIPAWPLNGNFNVTEPMLTPFIDKEIALYNKMSRRNHLLYGAATYTPVISTNMGSDEFDAIVQAGLGSWLKLQQGDTADVLKTPTEALQDMDRAIGAGLEEMAKLGIRMLSPESAQSGVALELRNASQTAQLGSLNSKVSTIMSAIIAFMIRWRYGIEIAVEDVMFNMSEDFDHTPLGADWLRLATEWYESGLIPRSLWLRIGKQNDVVPPDYDDVKGQEEINESDVIVTSQEQKKFDNDMQLQIAGGPEKDNGEKLKE